MTDNTQELDEILNKAIAVKVQNSVPLMPNSAKVVEVRLQYQEAVRQLILDWHNKQVKDPFDYIEPCEPDCSPERHAYHQGQWDMAHRMADLGLTTDKLKEVK